MKTKFRIEILRVGGWVGGGGWKGGNGNDGLYATISLHVLAGRARFFSFFERWNCIKINKAIELFFKKHTKLPLLVINLFPL